MTDLQTWLQEKLAKAERGLIARQQTEAAWKGGTDAVWKSVGCKLTPSERQRVAAREGRIAAKVERDIEMLKRLIELTS